jgi:type II secretory pathway component PulK
MSARTRGRDGFALLAALWLLVGVSALVLAVALAGREATHAARNRVALTRARWRAADCLERARAALAAAVARDPARAPGAAPAGWSAADRAVAESPLVPAECALRVRAAGTRVDVNTADVEMLSRLFQAAGVPSFRADSLADAIADWRDDDDVPRPLGAERAWYAARGAFPPRDAPLADVRELARVRGWSAALDTLVDVDSARIALGHAPPAVLAALPGMGPEALSVLAGVRERGGAVVDLAAFGRLLSPGARQAFETSFPLLAPRVALEPDAWIVTSRAAEGHPAVAAVMEITLARAATRLAVVRRRSWTE